MKTSKLLRYCVTAFALIQSCMADRMPEFSWDTVPRYMHVRKATAFTQQEIAYLASFPLVTFEKNTGHQEFGSTEAGVLKAAEAVKKVNPETKVLYYRNIIVHYGGYAANAELEAMPNAFLADDIGDTKLVRGAVRAYDLSNPAVRKWWLSSAKEVCSSDLIDGLFVDGSIKVLEPGYLKKDVGAEKKDAVAKAYHQMMKQLPKVLGPDKLVVANIIRARFEDAGLKYMDYFDGSYIEGFQHAVGKTSNEDYVAKGIAAIQMAARKGKIIAFTTGLGKGDESDPVDVARGTADLDQDSLTYAIALFLICAEKYSYLMLSDGYGVDGGRSKLWMRDIPEFNSPLGAPLGPAVREGYVYTRKFEHADVWIDIKKRKARINEGAL